MGNVFKNRWQTVYPSYELQPLYTDKKWVAEMEKAVDEYIRQQQLYLDKFQYGYKRDIDWKTKETKVETKKWLVMHEKADKPVAYGTGSVKLYHSEDEARKEAEYLTSTDPAGASYYVLTRVLKTSPVARTITTRL